MMPEGKLEEREEGKQRPVKSDTPFMLGLFFLFGVYFLLIVLLLVGDSSYTSLSEIGKALKNPDIQLSIQTTLLSCLISTILSVIVAVPTGYLFSRYRFPGKTICDAVLDIPIMLPPLVIGLSLLILFHQVHLFGESIETWCSIIFTKAYYLILRKEPGFDVGITYKVPAIILAQFTVSCAFAIRSMRIAFDQTNPRQEQVALTLGCNKSQAFWLIAVPNVWRGIVTAGALAWARALGEFGPILVFAGITRGRTEVLSTSIFLELSVGNLKGAVAVSMLMVAIALLVLFLVRLVDSRKEGLFDIR